MPRQPHHQDSVVPGQPLGVDDLPTRAPKPVARVLTVSDRCSAGVRADRSGPLARELLNERFEVDRIVVVSDDLDAISCAISDALDDGVRLIFTTGGTGITPRDHTPEATLPFVQTRLEGIEHAIRERGPQPFAAISRGIVGVSAQAAGAAVIVNAPGSTGGVKDACSVIVEVAPHLIDQLDGGDH